jgi:hypothetical protein
LGAFGWLFAAGGFATLHMSGLGIASLLIAGWLETIVILGNIE